MEKRETIQSIREKAARGEKLVMITAYDYCGAGIADKAGVDMILIGDSLGMVVLGYENTLSVTVDDIVYHTKAVVRGSKKALIVADMPFMSYQCGWQDAVRNAGRLLAEGGAEAVKLEGGRRIASTVRRLVEHGIPVMGHLGLTPQSVNVMGTRLQGNTAAAALELAGDALLLEKAGVFSLVLEKIPARLAGKISAMLAIPTIGIGSGGDCGGQVLVYHDLLGFYEDMHLKFVKKYAVLGAEAQKAVADYGSEVRTGAFPGPEHAWEMAEEEWRDFLSGLKQLYNIK
ncbi:MAG: 3-methyl-2-oxobutanoate hydroxymethyltransferase [Bacillota bacterium]